jgi:hypothetical protein
MATPEFAGLSYRVWEALRDEAVAAMGAGQAPAHRMHVPEAFH